MQNSMKLCSSRDYTQEYDTRIFATFNSCKITHVSLENLINRIFTHVCRTRVLLQGFFIASTCNNCKYLTSFACICVIFHCFANFSRAHASFSEFLASARVFRTLPFDWAVDQWITNNISTDPVASRHWLIDIHAIFDGYCSVFPHAFCEHSSVHFIR